MESFWGEWENRGEGGGVGGGVRLGIVSGSICRFGRFGGGGGASGGGDLLEFLDFELESKIVPRQGVSDERSGRAPVAGLFSRFAPMGSRRWGWVEGRPEDLSSERNSTHTHTQHLQEGSLQAETRIDTRGRGIARNPPLRVGSELRLCHLQPAMWAVKAPHRLTATFPSANAQ